jgi:chromosome segregation protein
MLVAQDEAAASRQAELEGALAELHSRDRECAESAENARIRLDEGRARLDAIEAETTECKLRYERARALSGELERGFAEKFHVGFAEIAGSLQERLSTRDGEQDTVLLSDLRARAERIGEVNLAAASEVSELEERESGLSRERADLQSAATDLTHTIQKLNREARKRFSETFAAAAQNFADLFPKLLRGGKGRLELSEGDDQLDAGINILVQPAGKKVREIGLLSGGEKALSAMALIFSLFLLNPSPFCVLDEVDAPLDEFSLAAFTSLLGELKGRSQFLVITHNQRTMQAADQIHGVTMERPGISRVISLKIPQTA